METCSVKYALDVLSGKWKLYAMFVLAQAGGPLRFNELQRRTGASAVMLSKTLQELEGKKLVERREYPEIPPHVEYGLTGLGRGLTPALDSLGAWGHEVWLANEPPGAAG